MFKYSLDGLKKINVCVCLSIGFYWELSARFFMRPALNDFVDITNFINLQSSQRK